MQFNTLKREHKNKKTKTVGRGGKHAKTSGRGTKGQNARAGHKKRPEIRDFIKRIPKLRGRGKNVNTSIQTKPIVLNISHLNKIFKEGDIVSSKSLVDSGRIKMISGKMPKIKILGGGTLEKKLQISGLEISVSARLAIEKAGGSID